MAEDCVFCKQYGGRSKLYDSKDILYRAKVSLWSAEVGLYEAKDQLWEIYHHLEKLKNKRKIAYFYPIFPSTGQILQFYHHIKLQNLHISQWNV